MVYQSMINDTIVSGVKLTQCSTTYIVRFYFFFLQHTCTTFHDSWKDILEELFANV